MLFNSSSLEDICGCDNKLNKNNDFLKYAFVVLIIILLLMIPCVNSYAPIEPEDSLLYVSHSSKVNEGELDSQFVYNITANLSNIIFNVYDEEHGEIAKGRAFGTKGEHKAAEIIYENMTKIGLYTTIQKLDKHPGRLFNDIITKLEVINYTAIINGEPIDCFIAPSWNGLQGRQNQLNTTFNHSNLKIIPIPKFPCLYNHKLAKETEDFIFITKDQWYSPNWSLPIISLFKPFLDPIKHIMMLHLTSLFNIKRQTEFWYKFYPHCKGLILYDFNKDCHDMIYFGDSSKNSLPVLFINGSIGEKINENPDLFRIDFLLKQRLNSSVISYNVIGQLNGTDPTKTVIVSSLYDSWWCQGTADSAIGMAIVLAIAKYFYEHNLTPRYTVKFIAFSGEEYNIRGARYYEATHKDEEIIYMIDLNQVGFTQEEPRLTLDVVSDKFLFLNQIWDIVERTNYVKRTGDTADIKKIFWGSGIIPSNSYPFVTSRSSVKTVTFFKDGGWILHHRDGLNHTEGDVLKYFNWTDVSVTGELILNITKYLTIEPEENLIKYTTHRTDLKLLVKDTPS